MADLVGERIETAKDFGTGDANLVRRWLAEIKLAKKREKEWRHEAADTEARYRRESAASTGSSSYETGITRRGPMKFNILWANTETLRPTLKSRTPQPDIRRRFHFVEQLTREAEADPEIQQGAAALDKIARDGAIVLERAISALIDDGHFDEAVDKAIDDHLLPGRGGVRVHYKPIHRMVPRRMAVQSRDTFNDDGTVSPMLVDANGNELPPDAKVTIDDDGMFTDGEPEEILVDERAEVAYFEWDRFLMGPARCWNEVPWVDFESMQTRDDLIRNFGAEIGRKVELSHSIAASEKDEDAEIPPDLFKRAEVHEIWDKQTGQRIFISPGFKSGPLRRGPAPIQLKGFFPMPEPLYAVRSNRTTVPKPEFMLYKDQADELDAITARITKLTEMLKVRGVVDPSTPELMDLLQKPDGTLVPAESYMQLSDKGGLRGVMDFVPIEGVAAVVIQLSQRRAELVQEIFELTGISDIQRGQTDPRETKGAQALKAQFSSLRLVPRQKRVEFFIRDTFRLMAEVIAEEFSKETLQRITGKPVSDAMIQLFRDEKLRGYLIEVETDTTVVADEQADKQAVTEYLTAVGGFLNVIAQAKGAIPTPVAFKILKWASKRFKVSREIEDDLDAAMQQITQQGGDQNEENQGDQAKAQIELMKAQMKLQSDQLRMQNERLKIMQNQAKIEGEQAIKLRELELKEQDLLLEARQMQVDAGIDLAEIAQRDRASVRQTQSRAN